MRRWRHLFVISLAVFLWGACILNGWSTETAVLEVSPQRIEIDSFYHGTELTANCVVPVRSNFALVLRSQSREHELSLKGRAGPLWMNVGTITIKGAPEMYCLAISTEKEEDLSSVEVLAGYNIGYETLQRSVKVEAENADGNAMFWEFVKLKESEGLYRTIRNVERESRDAGSDRFSIAFQIPPSIAPGEYTISLYSFDRGQVLTNTSSKLVVKKVGLPAKISELAFRHSVLYGILAVVVAASAGLATGYMFGAKGKGGALT
jgi:hypothetical protein